MKRVHESVDYIQHPERKQMFIDHNHGGSGNGNGNGNGNDVFRAPSYVAILNDLTSISIEGYKIQSKNNSTSKYTVYKVRIVTEKAKWAVYRRYSEFDALYLELSTHWEIPELPPKRLFGVFSTEFLEKRQADLEFWLRNTLVDVDETVLRLPCVKSFLTKDLVEKLSERQTTAVGTPQSGNRTVPKPSISSVSNSSCASYATEDKEKDGSGNGNAYLDLSGDEDDKVLGKSLVTEEEANASTNIDMYIKGGDGYSNGRKPKLEDFEMVRVLGKGSFGKVILCRKKDTQKLYAVKVLKKKHVLKRKQLRHAKTERSVLGYLDHPFVVKLHYAFQTGDKLHFVLDFLPGGELFFHLGRFGRFDEDLGRFYTAEIALALGHLHSHHVVYRDLKPENILLDAEGHIKLADFGLSKEGIQSGTEGTHSFCGTPEYLAPEVLNRSGHGTSVDWWSLGALLYEMLTGLPPWYSQDRHKMFASIRHSELRFPPYVSVGAREILSSFLERDATKRLGSGNDIEEVKEHPFFEGLDWDALYRKELKSPFVPRLNDQSDYTNNPDTTNFDSCFTRMPLHSCAEIASSQSSQISPSRLGVGVASLTNAFNGFTFVEPSHLKEKLSRSQDSINSCTSQERQQQRMLEQQLLNLHDTLPNHTSSTSPTGLSS
eukprot:CAMPEP_0204864676 /NCGR_PEP_ID=MMETSP1348-20121228/4220_1 /ASSEMBLY_ACC=CAM_ASM_000700 /TAXON_ID=215587 /ORGANISM="Aplanochytrium stocchinoi, Strain GSBS06" /LENGTH=658 /DNA_ID=CAMNT_0052015361 /DNA_START=640 /DNA_END=2613 /DNA_ORIENTATION=+